MPADGLGLDDNEDFSPPRPELQQNKSKTADPESLEQAAAASV
jgi:hypothetical protein